MTISTRRIRRFDHASRAGFAMAILLLAIDTTLADTDDENAPRVSRPNVILIMADDMGWGDPEYMGVSNIRTPGLNQMARDGLTFHRFYAAAPVCSPTRASCLTGRHPFRQGIFGANSGHLLETEVHLAQVLKQNGYRTGHFGKWHLGTLTVELRESNRGGPRGAEHFAPPWDRDFDESFSTEAKVPTWDPLIKPQGVNRNTWWDPVTDDSQATDYGTHYWSNGTLVEEALRGDDSKLIMDRTVEFIQDGSQSDEPFFAVVWFHTPHLPVVGGPEWVEHYSDLADYERHYNACIEAMDSQITRLRNELARLEIADNTLICFCSDNGPEGNQSAPGSAGHLRGRKRSLFEGGVRVPGIMVWPDRIEPGMETKLPAVTSDYFLTVLDAAGINPPADRPLDGVSLATWFDELPERRGSPICFESGNQLTIVDDRYKLVLRRGQGESARLRPDDPTPEQDRFELYDLTNDESETTDVSAHHPDIVADLHARLIAWRLSCQASRRGEDD